METQTQMLITKEMTIGAIAEQYPSTVNVMTAYGLHCLGCHSNPYETLEQGMQGHGMDEQLLEKMLKDLNDIAKQDQEHHSHPSEFSGEFKIDLTEKAAQKIKGIMQTEKKENYGLRVGASPGGCSGFRYVLDFEEKPTEQDTVVEAHGVKMFVENSAREMLNQLHIDFVEGLNESGFKISNPSAHSTCGCGSSFH